MKLFTVLAALAFVAGCGTNGDQTSAVGGASQFAETSPGSPESQLDSEPAVSTPKCPQGATNCQSASGVIIYVERVDPDGDGDAHFVLLSDAGITAPGISASTFAPTCGRTRCLAPAISSPPRGWSTRARMAKVRSKPTPCPSFDADGRPGARVP
jgi:hypothetical protein